MTKRNPLKAWIILLISLSTQMCAYDDIQFAGDIHIAGFPDDKEAAIAFTFDDNCPSSLTTIAPLFSKYGYPATFFVIPGIVRQDQWQKWRDLSDSGFEIGNHSLTHPDLTRVKNIKRLDQEINGAHEIITQKIGKAPFSFAHPGHTYNATVDSMVFQKHYATRAFPSNFCTWWGLTSKCSDYSFEDFLDEGVDKNWWMVIAAHGVDDGWEPISKRFLEKGLNLVKNKSDKIFVDHFGNLARYKMQRENTNVSIKRLYGKLKVTLESSLDTTVFNYPLTLVINKPNLKPHNISAIDGTKIIDMVCKNDQTLLKLLPKSQIEISDF